MTVHELPRRKRRLFCPSCKAELHVAPPIVEVIEERVTLAAVTLATACECGQAIEVTFRSKKPGPGAQIVPIRSKG